MPRRRTSLKTKRKDKKRRLRNIRIKRELKKTIKQFRSYLSKNDADEAKKFLSRVF